MKAASVQLNVRVDSSLANRLRQRADELHSNPGALVAQAIEQLLAQSPTATAGGDIEQRLADLEQRLADLEQKQAQKDSQ